MPARKLENLRNIGIIAHIDAGKTTLTEHMLYYSGAKHRVGKVDSGTTETDADPEEQERGITIYAAAVTFPWKDVMVNLLDTPGHVDFTAEVERCLRVLDGAVVVFSAREGVEAQSETVWRQANRYHVPRVAFINKMDREGAEFDRVFKQIETRLSARPVALQVPVGAGPAHTPDAFRGVIDLIEQKMLVFDPETEGKNVTIEEIPEEHQELAHLWRSEMLEVLYDYSNEIMELALQEEPIPVDLIRKTVRNATLHLQIQPVLCGSALHGIGVQPVLDAVQYYLPSPAEVPSVTGTVLDKKKQPKEEKRQPRPDEPFCGLVFKVLPAKTGDMHWVRIYSGELKANSRMVNPRLDVKENIAQLWHIHALGADRQEGQVKEATTGDIVGVIGMRHSITGDTVCDPKEPIQLESIQFPETVISMAIEPESAAERKKLEESLDMLKRQDPTLQIKASEAGQTLISGMGELHLEIIKNRLLRDFKLNVKFHKPQVSYRETVEQAVEVTGECNRVVGGTQLYARLTLRMEPYGEGSQPVVVLNKLPFEALPENLRSVAMEAINDAAQGGGEIYGFPLMKLRVTLLNAEQQEGATDEQAIRIAAADAFRRGLQEGGPVLLEPIMKVDLTAPEEYLGDLVNDLQQRRAIIAKTETSGGTAEVEAHAPLERLFGYSGDMRSLSQGRASCSMEPLDYAPAPPEVVKRYTEFVM
jgi:elongation factor G